MFSKSATKIDEIFTVDLTICTMCQIDGEDFVNFSGLLRKHELYHTKVLFTDRCRWQNFCPSLFHLANNCVESIYKTQKTRAKVLPSATVGE